MRKPPHILVLFSGGLDSTLVLGWARRRGHRITTLEIDHPGRPRGERRAANRVARALGVKDRIQIRMDHEIRRRNATDGYLANRNLLFHAIAQSIGETLGATGVAAGHRTADAEDFPDAKPSFLQRIERLARDGRPDHARLPILTPIRHVSEARLAHLVRAWNLPASRAWSCWHDRPKPCGRCEKCRRLERILGSAQATPTL